MAEVRMGNEGLVPFIRGLKIGFLVILMVTCGYDLYLNLKGGVIKEGDPVEIVSVCTEGNVQAGPKVTCKQQDKIRIYKDGNRPKGMIMFGIFSDK